jgi:hypothetical protein
MSNLSLYSPSNTGLSRSSNRLPSAVRGELSHLQNQTIVKSARMQATEYLATEAMHAVVGLTELEGQLCTLSPLSATRLQVIGNLAALQIARILH